jgi:hypothetical protein
MRNRALSVARIVLPFAAVVSLGCQSPWQSGAPAATGGGWFSWMSMSERSSDPLARLAGGGAYTPGVAEADANAKGSRQQLYGARTSELDLSRGSAQALGGDSPAPESAVAAKAPQPTTMAQALPSAEDDAASRVARALQDRQNAMASPALATGPNPTEGYDAAVAPAGYQAPDASGGSAAPPISAAPRTFVGTAPAGAESNPFFDPFGETSRTNSTASSSQGSGIASAFPSSQKPSGTGSSALRLLTTPPASEPSPPTLTYPSGSTSSAPTGSLLRLLGDNPLRKDAPAPSGN